LAAQPLVEIIDKSLGRLQIEFAQGVFNRQTLNFKVFVAKKEIDNISNRMLIGRKAHLKRGEPPGRPLHYGYKKDKNKQIIINVEETNIVRKIFDWYILKKNNMEIRKLLNESGVYPRTNKIWSKAMIGKILTFEGYASGKYKTSLGDEEFLIPCPTIIPMNIWQKSLVVREGNKSIRGSNVKEDYLCKGMVICPCGWIWTVRTCHSKGQTGKCGYYGCARKDHQPEFIHPNCPGTIGAKKLDFFVWDFVKKICANHYFVRKVIDSEIAIIQSKQETLDVEREYQIWEKDLLSQEIQGIIEMLNNEKIYPDEVKKQLAAIDTYFTNLRKISIETTNSAPLDEQISQLNKKFERYQKRCANSFRTLETNVEELSEEESDNLCREFEVYRFEEKSNSDKKEVLQKAIIDEKRWMIRLVIGRVLLVKIREGEKKIIPLLVHEPPEELSRILYDEFSLEIIQKFKQVDSNIIGDFNYQRSEV
jgi:hypothetical protein